MKKLLLELLKQHFYLIIQVWSDKINQGYQSKLNSAQTTTFVENTLNTIMEIIETADYSVADQYLIDIYSLFTKNDLNLLEISNLFSQGRFSIINIIENDKSYDFDAIILLRFLDEVIEQLYARFGMLYQETKLKEMKTDRDRIESKLLVSQQYLKNILSTSDSAIMEVDEKEKFISWNKGAEKIFGYKEEEVIGKHSGLLLPDGEKYSGELYNIIESVKSVGSLSLNETERKTKDGRLISVNLTVTKLPSNDGEYVGRSIIIKDHSEVKKLQQQVDQSEKLAVIGKLAAGVAHEIGNPLASISSLVQILQRKSNEEFTREQLSTIKENIDRISRIVRELVDFSRPPSHELQLTKIMDVVKTALGIVKYDKRVKKVQFINDFYPELPQINIVPDQLLQVLVNILLNALDAIEGNGTIRVSTNVVQDYIIIEINDDGCGMDESVIRNIFDPFFTTKEVGKGTGLGLSVSYGIVKKFRGDIQVESVPGKGSTFFVKLPVDV